MNEQELKNLWNNSTHAVAKEQIANSLKILLLKICLFESKKSGLNKKQIKRYSLYRVACIVLVPLLLSTCIYLLIQNNSKQELYISNVEYFSPIGKPQKIILPDSTIVFLNSSSVLISPEKFIAEKRTVFLVGEAYFDVAHNPDKPFIVKTALMEIEALGTEFSVLSYPKDKSIQTTLVNGSVKLSVNDSQNVPEPIILSPNQQSFYNPLMNNIDVKNIDIQAYTSWITGDLIFEETPFKDIIQRLEIQYNHSISYNKQLEKNTISAKFTNNESLEEILNILSKVAYFKYIIKGDQVWLE